MLSRCEKVEQTTFENFKDDISFYSSKVYNLHIKNVISYDKNFVIVIISGNNDNFIKKYKMSWEDYELLKKKNIITSFIF